MRLDCLGDMCPLPLMRLIKCRGQIDRGECVTVVTDHSCTRESLVSYCRKQKLSISIDEPVTGVWEIHVRKEGAPGR